MLNIQLQLLDSDQTRPLQTWQFTDRESITLGRAEDNDVVIADPYVSRAHAHLTHDSLGWRVSSISRQRLMIKGVAVDEYDLHDGVVFRLGPHGCSLRFMTCDSAENNHSTITFDPVVVPALQLDAAQVSREVEQIAQGDYFLQLKQAANALRGKRIMEDTWS
ncbi:MAG: FHA domain-containing protein [Pirellulales bacterium]|nr:FHA domain-containing protein [Pirellulales bacterium]